MPPPRGAPMRTARRTASPATAVCPCQTDSPRLVFARLVHRLDIAAMRAARVEDHRRSQHHDGSLELACTAARDRDAIEAAFDERGYRRGRLLGYRHAA